MDISAKKGTTNTLSDGTPTSLDEDGEPDACIFSHDDITLKGKGELTINGNYANGVSTKDKLVVKNLTLNVNSVGNCLKGKDLVTIESGTLTLVSTTADGVRGTKSDDDGNSIIINGGTISITAKDNGLFAKTGNVVVNGGDLTINTDTTSADTSTYNYDGIHTKAGSISLNGGSVTITAYCDGVQSATDLSVGAAKLNITTTGTTTTTSSNNGRPMWQESSSDSGASSKGLKAESTIEIADGADITVTSTDDSIHSNDTIEINGGTMVLSSGDDGVHADTKLTVNGGSVDVTKSYEGLEAASIYINDGNISVKSSDDSINAAGGNDSSGNFGMSSSSTGYMEFNGGYVYCENTDDGDGIDSNGSIVINGGTLLINGTSQSDNAPIDYGDGSSDYLAYNGGIVVAVGSSGMAVTPDKSKSTGYSLYYTASNSSNKGGFSGGFGGGFNNNFGGNSSSSSSITAGTVLTLTDASGNVVVSFETKNAATFVMISSPELKSGSTYTLYKDGTYSGTLNDNGYATGGTLSDGTKLASATISSKATSMS
jgi:hypothetical protein